MKELNGVFRPSRHDRPRLTTIQVKTPIPPRLLIYEVESDLVSCSNRVVGLRALRFGCGDACCGKFTEACLRLRAHHPETGTYPEGGMVLFVLLDSDAADIIED
jgi:hypothetical protein